MEMQKKYILSYNNEYYNKFCDVNDEYNYNLNINNQNSKDNILIS